MIQVILSYELKERRTLRGYFGPPMRLKIKIGF